MPKIEVWECPHTGEMFKEEKPYRAHLKRLSRRRIARRKQQAIRDSVKDIVADARNAENVQELVDYIIKHQREFMINGCFNDSSDSELMHKALREGWDIKFPQIEMLGIRTAWRSEVSNSHNCPRDGETNWGGDKKGVPRHYPGWHGRIEMRYNKNHFIQLMSPDGKKSRRINAPSISDMAASFGDSSSICGICTGSGGGGNPTNSYEVSLFQSDFPNMEKVVTFAIIGEEPLTRMGGRVNYQSLDKLGQGKFEIKELENA